MTTTKPGARSRRFRKWSTSQRFPEPELRLRGTAEGDAEVLERKRANRATMQVVEIKSRSNTRPRDIKIWGDLDEPTHELHVRCQGQWVLWYVGGSDACCRRALSMLCRPKSGITNINFLERVEPIVDQERRHLRGELRSLEVLAKLIEHLKVATKDQPVANRMTVRRYRDSRRALLEWRRQIEQALAIEKRIPAAVSPTIKQLYSSGQLLLRAHVPVALKRSRLTRAARRRAINARNAARAANIRRRELQAATR